MTESAVHPRAFRLYLAIVVLAAAVSFALLTPSAGPARPFALGIVLALMVVSEFRPVQLPSGGYATGSAVIGLASIIILGPVWTAWVDVASTVVVQGLLLRKPPVRVLHNLAIFALTTLAAGYGFLLAGGTVGQLVFPRHIVPLLVCGGLYFLFNSAFVSVVLGLTSGPGPWRIWQRNFLQGILHHLSFVALGTLVAVVYFGTGPWGLALVVILEEGVARLDRGGALTRRASCGVLLIVLGLLHLMLRRHAVRAAAAFAAMGLGLQLLDGAVRSVSLGGTAPAGLPLLATALAVALALRVGRAREAVAGSAWVGDAHDLHD